jgi:hypothetical protein
MTEELAQTERCIAVMAAELLYAIIATSEQSFQ